MWKLSGCKGPWLHRFVLHRTWGDCQEEVCEVCHARQFFKVRGGRVDNYQYLSWHLRSALQRWHPRFKKEYPST